jgi:hypothetical protein
MAEDKPDLALELDRLGNDQLRLENRVYSLEKEMALCVNLLTAAAIIALYFGYRWYVENVLTIPGVAHE